MLTQLTYPRFPAVPEAILVQIQIPELKLRLGGRSAADPVGHIGTLDLNKLHLQLANKVR